MLSLIFPEECFFFFFFFKKVECPLLQFFFLISVLECPDNDFLDSLTTSQPLLKLAGHEKDEPQVIVHMTPSHVIETPAYQEFIKR